MLDTGVLVLLIAGSVSPKLLGKVRHLKDFAPGDFDLLLRYMRRFRTVAVTAHVVTEASHFLSKIEGKYGSQMRASLKTFMEGAKERNVPSRTAMTMTEFNRFDLADCALLLAASNHDMLLSTDGPLVYYRQAQNLPAANFNHLREQDWKSKR